MTLVVVLLRDLGFTGLWVPLIESGGWETQEEVVDVLALCSIHTPPSTQGNLMV